MKRLNQDTVSAVVLLLFCGLFFWASTQIRDMGFETLGSEVWPQIILTVLTLLSLLYLARSLRGPLGDVAATSSVAGRTRGVRAWVNRYSNVFGCFALFGLFLVTLPYLGMLIGGVLFVFSALTLLGPWNLRSVLTHATIALLAVGGMWALFTFGLKVILPEGELLRVI